MNLVLALNKFSRQIQMMQYRPHRYQTQFPIVVRTSTGPEQARIIDVNNEGARLTGLRRLIRGEKLALDVLSHRVDAVVTWSAHDKAGISFRPRLTDDQVDTLRHRKDSRAGHRRGSIGFSYAEMR